MYLSLNLVLKILKVDFLSLVASDEKNVTH